MFAEAYDPEDDDGNEDVKVSSYISNVKLTVVHTFQTKMSRLVHTFQTRMSRLVHTFQTRMSSLVQGCGSGSGGSGSRRENFSNKSRKKARKLLITAILFYF